MSKEKISVTVGSFGVVENGNGKDERHRNQQGLGWIITSFFVVGDLAGGGIVALPAAIVQTNFLPGLVMNVVMALSMTYTAHMLGLSWTILQRRWPEYREHCRKPYPEMGGRAMAIGLIGGSLSTYTALKELATTRFAMPCYVQPFLPSAESNPPEGYLNCCGVWQNITRLEDISDCNPYMDFYNQKL